MSSSNQILYPIILNSSNVQSNSNNSKYVYNFPAGSVRFAGSKVAVASISMYYSWYNITSANGNNTLSYTFPTFVGSTTVSITIPDGFYSISELNSYLQSVMITNGHYLVDSGGDYVYYLELVTNGTYYSIQYNSFPVPTALPVGYSNPAAMTFPVVASTPLLIVPSTTFQNIIGFDAGTYPSVFQATTYSKLSDFTPQVSPVQSLLLSCTLLNNKYSSPGTILYSMTNEGVGFGELINSRPVELAFIPIQDGNYSSFEVQFLDQSYNSLVIQDSNLVITLLISNPTQQTY